MECQTRASIHRSVGGEAKWKKVHFMNVVKLFSSAHTSSPLTEPGFHPHPALSEAARSLSPCVCQPWENYSAKWRDTAWKKDTDERCTRRKSTHADDVDKAGKRWLSNPIYLDIKAEARKDQRPPEPIMCGVNSAVVSLRGLRQKCALGNFVCPPSMDPALSCLFSTLSSSSSSSPSGDDKSFYCFAFAFTSPARQRVPSVVWIHHPRSRQEQCRSIFPSNDYRLRRHRHETLQDVVLMTFVIWNSSAL